MAAPSAVRLRPGDLAALASIGLRTRKLRAGLSALGIAIGVAAIVAVLGLAASSTAALLAQIQALGTNLLTVTNGQTLTGAAAELPVTAPGMIARLPGVTAVQDNGTVSGVSVYKSPLIPAIETNGLSVDAATLGLPKVAGTSLAQGRFLNAATAREPAAVLGATTAQLLGIDRIRPGERIRAGRPVVLPDRHPQPCRAGAGNRLRGPDRLPRRGRNLHFDGHPSQIYVRTVDTPAAATRIDHLLGAQASPQNPGQVTVSQPSDALTAQADAKGALDTLFLGLGAVALLVGAIGVANIMVIAVLERRPEIGLRRALGATRGHIRTQFLAEAILLSLAGGCRRYPRRRRHRRLRPHPRRGRCHPARSLAARPGRGYHHRRPSRAAARHPRRPPVPHSGALEHLTAQAPRTASFAGCRCEQRLLVSLATVVTGNDNRSEEHHVGGDDLRLARWRSARSTCPLGVRAFLPAVRARGSRRSGPGRRVLDQRPAAIRLPGRRGRRTGRRRPLAGPGARP